MGLKMFVVVKWASYNRPKEMERFERREEAEKYAGDPTTFEQIDFYEVKNPDSWTLLKWKPFGEGKEFLLERKGRKGLGFK